MNLTALVLAGSRPGEDPLVTEAGVTHKAMIEVGGQTMLQRVVSALAAVPEVSRVVIAIERPELLSTLRSAPKPVVAMPAASGPSASVAAALQSEGTPLLVTTADHALLRPEWVREFIAGVPPDVDAAVALAHRDAVTAAVPETERTWLSFSDGHYSGCNLFLFRTPAALGVVKLWQELEAFRKRPMAMMQRLGLGYAMRYKAGRLKRDEAIERLSELSGARLAVVTLTDGRAAIDVDKTADLLLVRRLVET